jgi:hypothetical protein
MRRLRTSACDIYADAFVTYPQQRASGIQREEAIQRASCSHAPKLRLGETHVPLGFLARREKTLPIVVKIGYARY